mgnify:CR=1 FL=1
MNLLKSTENSEELDINEIFNKIDELPKSIYEIIKPKIDLDKVKTISSIKKEEDWVLNFRLDSYSKFMKIDNPNFGPEIDLDFSEIIYYKANERDEMIQSDWNNVLKPVVDELDDNVVLATRNLNNVLLLSVDEINTMDIVSAKVLIATESAVKSIEEVLV